MRVVLSSLLLATFALPAFTEEPEAPAPAEPERDECVEGVEQALAEGFSALGVTRPDAIPEAAGRLAGGRLDGGRLVQRVAGPSWAGRVGAGFGSAGQGHEHIFQ